MNYQSYGNLLFVENEKFEIEKPMQIWLWGKVFVHIYLSQFNALVCESDCYNFVSNLVLLFWCNYLFLNIVVNTFSIECSPMSIGLCSLHWRKCDHWPKVKQPITSNQWLPTNCICLHIFWYFVFCCVTIGQRSNNQ